MDAHLAHGDGLPGLAVPGQPGTQFDDSCNAVTARHTITVSGSWDGNASFFFSGLFTVSSEGPVDANATVTGFSGEMRLALLGFDASSGTCSTIWLPEPLPAGPGMNTPTITAHWDLVPAGTYCLNVVQTAPVPPWPGPYSWTATITYP